MLHDIYNKTVESATAIILKLNLKIIIIYFTYFNMVLLKKKNKLIIKFYI